MLACSTTATIIYKFRLDAQKCYPQFIINYSHMWRHFINQLFGAHFQSNPAILLVNGTGGLGLKWSLHSPASSTYRLEANPEHASGTKVGGSTKPVSAEKQFLSVNCQIMPWNSPCRLGAQPSPEGPNTSCRLGAQPKWSPAKMESSHHTALKTGTAHAWYYTMI